MERGIRACLLASLNRPTRTNVLRNKYTTIYDEGQRWLYIVITLIRNNTYLGVESPSVIRRLTIFRVKISLIMRLITHH